MNNLKKYRKIDKLTLKQLANKINCSKGYLSQLERGIGTPSIPFAYTVANALNVSVYDIWPEKYFSRERLSC